MQDKSKAVVVAEMIDLLFRSLGYDYIRGDVRDNLGHSKYVGAAKWYYAVVNKGFYFRGPRIRL